VIKRKIDALSHTSECMQILSLSHESEPAGAVRAAASRRASQPSWQPARPRRETTTSTARREELPCRGPHQRAGQRDRATSRGVAPISPFPDDARTDRLLLSTPRRSIPFGSTRVA